MAQHSLDPVRGNVTDMFSRDLDAVLSVDPGDTVVVGSLDASGYLRPQTVPGESQPTMFPERRGHCLTGPILVRGAEPGMHLSVHVRSLRPGGWGWTVAGAADNDLNRALGVTGDPTWLLWELDDGTARNQLGFARPLAPFLGVLGVAPAEPGEHSTIPPRAGAGGNVDCRSLTAGSTLYLPVQVPGALLSVGDGHAAQGDGEVCGTAIECPMTSELVVDLVRDAPVVGIHAVASEGRITFGFDADLNAATKQALSAMLTWMSALHDLDRTAALALASVAVDLRVTQVANGTWGVHALLPDGLLTRT
jgi:acetamidase/formamidase